MKRILLRAVGIALIIAGVAGLMLCTIALVVVDRAQRGLETTLSQQFDLLERAVEATSDGLDIAQTTLDQTVGTVHSLKGTIMSIGATVKQTKPTLDAVAALMGDQLPAAVEATQETLASASASAKAVDDALSLISKIPFLGGEKYDPEQQLHVGLEQVAASLDGVPDSLRQLRGSLADASSSIVELEGGLSQTADGIGGIAESLSSAENTLTQYNTVIADLGSSLSSLRSSLPQALRWLRLGISFILVWLGIVQFALITQGGELVTRSRRGDSQ